MAIFQSPMGENKVQNADAPKQPSTARKVFRYANMPEIIPRIRAIGFHFGHFAYLLAMVFASARLIPHSHPVMNAANMGHFGVRQVIAIAANNLVWDKKHIDQIAIFCAIMMGIVMIVIQLGLIAILALAGGNEAEAASYFTVDAPEKDVVLQVLNLIFGPVLPTASGTGGFFFAPMDPDYSAISGNYGPIHQTVYSILALYSNAMMVIAVIIVLYYILTVVGEAAKTGTPFGQRFNSLWAPIRLIVALGLLVPLASGLNSAQYITLWVAKMGSNLGTQTWYIFFDNVVSTNPNQYVMTEGDTYSFDGIVYNAFLSEICIQGYNEINTAESNVTWSRSSPIDIGEGFKIVWGVGANADDATDNARSCGELTVNPSASNATRGRNNPNASGSSDNLVPIDQIVTQVRNIVENTIIPDVEAQATTFVNARIAVPSTPADMDDIKDELDTIADTAAQAYKTQIEQIYQTAVTQDLQTKIEQDRDKGWAYAGVWYLQIGRIIQQLENPKTTAIPTMQIPDQETRSMESPGFWQSVGNTLGFGTIDRVESSIDSARELLYTPSPMTAAQRRAARHGTRTTDSGHEDTAYNACIGLDGNSSIIEKTKCTVLSIIVPDQLFVIKNGSTLDPMAALIGAGGQIFERAMYLVLAGIAAEAGGAILSYLPVVGGLLDALGGIAIMVGLLGLAAGFVLFFLLPLMPFVYFFFAILSWFMEIFEAVVAMPLWALAHLRIDGDGMPGQAAANGYFLLLAILIRPALIIIGLIGGYLIFIAGTYFISLVFDQVLNVTTGDDTAGMQMLIFTLIFSYLVYTIGTIAFKMVDTVPQQILRWIGSGAQSFNDSKGDIYGSTQGAVIAAAAVGSSAANQIGGSAKGMGQGIRKKKDEEANQEFSANQRAEDHARQDAKHSEMMGALGGRGPDAPGAGPSGGGGGGGGGSPSGGSGFGGRYDPSERDSFKGTTIDGKTGKPED